MDEQTNTEALENVDVAEPTSQEATEETPVENTENEE